MENLLKTAPRPPPPPPETTTEPARERHAQVARVSPTHRRHRERFMVSISSPVSVSTRGARCTFERGRPGAIAVRAHQVHQLHPFHIFVCRLGAVARTAARSHPHFQSRSFVLIAIDRY